MGQLLLARRIKSDHESMFRLEYYSMPITAIQMHTFTHKYTHTRAHPRQLPHMLRLGASPYLSVWRPFAECAMPSYPSLSCTHLNSRVLALNLQNMVKPSMPVEAMYWHSECAEGMNCRQVEQMEEVTAG